MFKTFQTRLQLDCATWPRSRSSTISAFGRSTRRSEGASKYLLHQGLFLPQTKNNCCISLLIPLPYLKLLRRIPSSKLCDLSASSIIVCVHVHAGHPFIYYFQHKNVCRRIGYITLITGLITVMINY